MKCYVFQILQFVTDIILAVILVIVMLKNMTFGFGAGDDRELMKIFWVGILIYTVLNTAAIIFGWKKRILSREGDIIGCIMLAIVALVLGLPALLGFVNLIRAIF